MKKVIYIVVVLAILLVLSMLLKDNFVSTNETSTVAEAPVAVEETVAEVAPLAEGAVVVDVEPTAEAAAETTAEPTAEAAVVAEEVVEENPSATADEGETVVE